jgi:hypothetical protein
LVLSFVPSRIGIITSLTSKRSAGDSGRGWPPPDTTDETSRPTTTPSVATNGERRFMGRIVRSSLQIARRAFRLSGSIH